MRGLKENRYYQIIINPYLDKNMIKEIEERRLHYSCHKNTGIWL